MPKRYVQTHMIVKTPNGLVLVDKDGNERPLKEVKKTEKKVDTTKKK